MDDPKIIAAIIGSTAGLLVAIAGHILSFIMAKRNQFQQWRREDHTLHIQRQVDACADLLKIGIKVSTRYNNAPEEEKGALEEEFMNAMSIIQLICPEVLSKAALKWCKDINLIFSKETPNDMNSWGRNRKEFIKVAQKHFRVKRISTTKMLADKS